VGGVVQHRTPVFINRGHFSAFLLLCFLEFKRVHGNKRVPFSIFQ